MQQHEPACDFARPFPLQFRGSAVARGLLRLFGWKVRFEGLPAQQGVLIVYPHTSNWDFVVMIVAKWSVGVQVHFWGKDRLFNIPLFGRWLRWVGGVPVDRSAARGVVGQAVAHLEAARATASYFWLGLAPEGTRKPLGGLRSGFYRTAVEAGVPLGLIKLDFALKEVSVLDFIELTGDEAADMARIANVFQGVQGRVPGNAAPVRLLDPAAPRTDTIAR
jgi:1-acyl-sn-glycerol-3-phosphate acyltransferase